MPATEFSDRIASRINRIDRKNLEDYALDLAKQTKFLANLFDQVPEGIMVLSQKMEILFLSRRMIQLFNIQESAARKRDLKEAIPDEPLLDLIVKTIEQKKELFQKEFEVLLPRPMILRINLILEKNETQPIFILSIANLTQVEISIRERFKLENWESMLGLAAGIAHEIGNPLNSLTIHLKLIEKALPKLPLQDRTKIENSLRSAQDETARLDQIVRNFLKVTRRKPLKFELAQINDLVSKTVTFLKPELKTAKIRVQEELDKRIPFFLLDPERIHQVFLNIIKNAVHAMPKGGTLKIQTQLKEKICFIRFQDTGIGISDESIPKIFDAYYTTKEEGSGLGLMIVYQIIREHGGRIEVASKKGLGTTFTIILPLRKEKLGLPEPKRTST